MATKKKENSIPLKSVAGKLDGYFSGKGYNFYERFIYSRMFLHLHLNNNRESLLFLLSINFLDHENQSQS